MRKFKTIAWACIDCIWTWDVLSVINDDETIEESCPNCKSYNTKQIIQAPPVQFKGEGFYETDYN